MRESSFPFGLLLGARGAGLMKVNSYPPRMLPGIDIMVCTSATNDKDARLLLSSLGVPFAGKHVN